MPAIAGKSCEVACPDKHHAEKPCFSQSHVAAINVVLPMRLWLKCMGIVIHYFCIPIKTNARKILDDFAKHPQA